MLLLAVIYTATQWSFDRGMLNYVNQKELASLQLLSKNLARYYQQEQTWSTLVISKNTNKRLPSRRKRLAPPQRNNQAPPQKNRTENGPNKTWHQIVGLSNEGIELPDDTGEYLQRNSNFRPQNQEKNKSHLRNNSLGRLHPSLLDVQKQQVLGPINDDFSLQAILLNEEVIGYLALPPKIQLTNSFDLAFAEQAKTDLLYIVCTLFLLISIIAIPLSRHFIMPIQRLDQAMRKLNKGDFKVNIDVKGNDEIASLSLNFNDLAKTLEHNEHSRNTWLANISHELRTPIAIIKGEIEAIQDGIRPLDYESLSSLDEEVKHLHKLVNDLSALSNAEIGAMRYQKTQLNLTEIVNQNLIRHNHQAYESGISINQNITTSALNIWADKTRVNQVLDNIINNSFKYTQAPGTVHISLTKEAYQAVLIISDSSPGVPDASLSKLFEHLYRIESSRNRKTGGSGLGLALCKKIMHAHQGLIEAKHSEHGGLEIRCTFPLLT